MYLFPILAYGHEGIGDIVIRAIIHTVVWQAISPLFRHLGPFGAIIAAVVVIAIIAGLRRLRIV